MISASADEGLQTLIHQMTKRLCIWGMARNNKLLWTTSALPNEQVPEKVSLKFVSASLAQKSFLPYTTINAFIRNELIEDLL